MKNIFSLRLHSALIILFLATACNTNDEMSPGKLNGKWNLVNVSCFCPPAEFERGDHTWNFDLVKKEVSVLNAKNESLQVLETGTYEFERSNSKISIQSVTYDYYFENGKLILSDHPEVDGPLLVFIK